MKRSLQLSRVKGRHFTTKPAVALFLVASLIPLTLAMANTADATATSVLLGTTNSFGVLAGTGITNTGPTTINGDIGTYPTTSITGAGSMTITGTNHAGDAVTQQAKTDLVTAYNNAAGEGPTTALVSDPVGLTLAPGVYTNSSSIGLSGALTLDAAGDPNAVFVFQAGSTLKTGSASHISLINGARACNVFWQVGSSATLGTGSSFVGTVLALTSITVTTGVTINGRVLTRNGAITLDTDRITVPSCAAITTPTTTPSVAVTTTTAVTNASTPAAVAAAKAAAAKKAAATKAAARTVGAAVKAPTPAKAVVVPVAPPSPIGTTTVNVTG